MDSAAHLRQVPTTWNPQYGLYLDWPVFIVILSIVGLSGLAFITQLKLLFLAASLSSAVLLVSLVFPGRMVQAVELTKRLPHNGMVGEPMAITYAISNRRKYTAVRSLRVVELVGAGQLRGFPRAYIPYIAPGQTCSFEVGLTPVHRGQLAIRGTRLASKYPFGLLTWFKTIPDGREVTIYPALGRLGSAFLAGQRRTEVYAQSSQSRLRGSSDEFYALREYRRGDNPRLIHWKRSARMRKLVVREMCQYAPHRLTVILDTYLPDPTEAERERFEQAVSFAATLLCHSLETGYRVALICAGVPPTIVPPLSGRDAQHRILRTLSQVQCQGHSPLAALVQTWRWTGRWSGRCLVVTMTAQGQSLTDRLSQLIGPSRVLRVGSAEWSKVFFPPGPLVKEPDAS